MKRIILSIIVIASILFFVSSCGRAKDPICTYRGSGTVNELAVFPDSVALGSTIVAQFKVTGRDGCSQFDGFVDQNLMDMMTSPYIVSVPAPQISGFGCVCSEFMPIFDATYTYVPSDTGLYYFNYAFYGDVVQYDSVYVY